MKLLRGVAVLFVVLSYGSAFGTEDPVWLFVDSVNVIYGSFFCYDTARIRDMDRLYPTDTGASYDGSPYINFDYQFTTDSMIVRDPFDTNTIQYRDWRPGFAGFKTAWDYGITGFPLARYKYLIMAYKGPLSTHKVTIKFWYNGGACGDPSFFEIIGSFAASSTWMVDTIPIPESIQNKPDKARNNSKYYEMDAIINNLDPNDTNKSSPRGCLKIDNIRLAGYNPIDSSPVSQNVTEGEAVTFRVATSRADSADVLTYQWKKGGVDIRGADSSVYTLNSVKAADTGAYTVAVTVSSTNLSFTSLGATLTVNQPVPPIITAQPASQTVNVGQPVTFTVAATGTAPLLYQWRKDGNPISGKTSASDTVLSAAFADAGAYSVVVKNSIDSVTSAMATLTVNSPQQKKDNCGCGSGTGLALIPPLFFKAMAHRKRKKKNTRI